jgi:hypothetical protein
MKVGDVVKLKSGGALMTVTEVSGCDDKVDVKWYYEGKMCWDRITRYALIKPSRKRSPVPAPQS